MDLEDMLKHVPRNLLRAITIAGVGLTLYGCNPQQSTVPKAKASNIREDSPSSVWDSKVFPRILIYGGKDYHLIAVRALNRNAYGNNDYLGAYGTDDRYGLIFLRKAGLETYNTVQKPIMLGNYHESSNWRMISELNVLAGDLSRK